MSMEIQMIPIIKLDIQREENPLHTIHMLSNIFPIIQILDILHVVVFSLGLVQSKHKNEVKVHNRFLHLHNGCHIVSRLTIE